MTESKTTAPHFYVTVDINMDEAMKMREQLNAFAPDAEKISINDLIVAASAKTLTRFPELNASYREGSLDMHPQINGCAYCVDMHWKDLRADGEANKGFILSTPGGRPLSIPIGNVPPWTGRKRSPLCLGQKTKSAIMPWC